MKNIVIVSRGNEIARTVYDSKKNTTKATTFDPIEGEGNRANCMSIVVHTLNQLVEAENVDSVAIRSLNLVITSVNKLFATKRTLESAGIVDKEEVLKAFYDGMTVTEGEKEIWSQFYDLVDESNITFKKLPSQEDTETKLIQSKSVFNQNLGRAIQTAWERLPEVENTGVIEDEAI